MNLGFKSLCSFAVLSLTPGPLGTGITTWDIFFLIFSLEKTFPGPTLDMLSVLFCLLLGIFMGVVCLKFCFWVLPSLFLK